MADSGKRRYGIDLLRILSMLGIVVLHILNSGGAINETYHLWFLNTIAYSSVNCFAMITGFLYVTKDRHYQSLRKLLITTGIWCLLITVVFFTLGRSYVHGFSDIVYGLIPPLYWYGKTGGYWYLVSYVFLFMMIPYLNRVTSGMSKSQHKHFLIVLIVLASIIPTVFLRDFFYFNEGYSPFWLIVCYYIGSYIKIYEEDIKLKKGFLILFLFCSAIVALLTKIVITELTNHFLGRTIADNQFITYISPFVLANSATMLLLLRNVNVSNRRIQAFIGSLSSAAFSVYIIHCNPLIFNNLICDGFGWISNYNGFLQIAIVVAIAVAIYCVSYVLWFLFHIIEQLIGHQRNQTG